MKYVEYLQPDYMADDHIVLYLVEYGHALAMLENDTTEVAEELKRELEQVISTLEAELHRRLGALPAAA